MPADQTRVAAVAHCGRPGPGASAARPAGVAAQAGEATGAQLGAGGETASGLGAAAGGGVSGQGRADRGSRDRAPLTVGLRASAPCGGGGNATGKGVSASRVGAPFFQEETTPASYALLAGWSRPQGLPRSWSVDRDSISRCEGLGSMAEQRAGQAPQTQFGRALAPVGVALSLAHRPPAKSRVERLTGVLQDRLLKALRLAGRIPLSCYVGDARGSPVGAENSLAHTARNRDAC